MISPLFILNIADPLQHRQDVSDDLRRQHLQTEPRMMLASDRTRRLSGTPRRKRKALSEVFSMPEDGTASPSPSLSLLLLFFISPVPSSSSHNILSQSLLICVYMYTAKNLIPIRGHKRARYGTELQYQYIQLGQSHCIFCMGSALQLESTCNPSVGSRL